MTEKAITINDKDDSRGLIARNFVETRVDERATRALCARSYANRSRARRA